MQARRCPHCALTVYCHTLCSQVAKQYHRLRKNVRRVCFDRQMEAGEEVDKSEGEFAPTYCPSAHWLSVCLCAAPMCITAVIALMTAYAREGSAEAAERKLASWSLWQSVGRSSEVSWCTWDGLEYDPELKAMFVEILQVLSCCVSPAVTCVSFIVSHSPCPILCVSPTVPQSVCLILCASISASHPLRLIHSGVVGHKLPTAHKLQEWRRQQPDQDVQK
jgi:hypothetical protein